MFTLCGFKTLAVLFGCGVVFSPVGFWVSGLAIASPLSVFQLMLIIALFSLAVKVITRV